MDLKILQYAYFSFFPGFQARLFALLDEGDLLMEYVSQVKVPDHCSDAASLINWVIDQVQPCKLHYATILSFC